MNNPPTYRWWDLKIALDDNQGLKRMGNTDHSCVIHFGEAQNSIPFSEGRHSTSVLQRGTLNLKLSLPVTPNQQTPHSQDEIYVIARGRGILNHDGKRDSFETGDVMFIAAGTEHHFEHFTEDLAVWVVFYGPEGGEIPRV